MTEIERKIEEWRKSSPWNFSVPLSIWIEIEKEACCGQNLFGCDRSASLVSASWGYTVYMAHVWSVENNFGGKSPFHTALHFDTRANNFFYWRVSPEFYREPGKKYVSRWWFVKKEDALNFRKLYPYCVGNWESEYVKFVMHCFREVRKDGGRFF